jgi:hypothetical protein
MRNHDTWFVPDRAYFQQPPDQIHIFTHAEHLVEAVHGFERPSTNYQCRGGDKGHRANTNSCWRNPAIDWSVIDLVAL